MGLPESEAGHCVRTRYMYASGMSGASDLSSGRCRQGGGKVGSESAERSLERRTITISLLQFANLAGLSANYPNNTRHRGVGSCRHHFRDAVQAVGAMKVRLRVACRYSHTVHLRRDAKHDGTMGHEVTRRLRADTV